MTVRDRRRVVALVASMAALAVYAQVGLGAGKRRAPYKPVPLEQTGTIVVR